MATPAPGPERWARAKELFAAAADLPPMERAALLDREAGDPELRREVDRLLAADVASGPLDGGAWGAVDGAAERLGALARALGPDAAPVAIGPYRIERELGRGGMGEVYLAARADGQFDKRVAVKLVRRGLDTEDVLRRFRLEQHILGRLEHPGIARLYDAGATPDGRPYFVMEHVPGEPIDRWCEARGLPVRARLELFREVCAAVHSAHQNLVAHRDLKPSNILVGEDGRPRLLDFGIAKLLGPSPEGEPEPLTRTVERPMTPEYASPEQVRGEPVTTAADIYSLGVLLYELLAGRKPYRLAGLPAREVERLVAEVEPERPSRAAGAERLRRQLRGDLDNVVARAMHKEPGRRYATVDQLSEDVRRHLAGLPVVARGDGFWYRAGKLVRRHKLAAAFAALLAVAAVGLAVLSVATARALDRAERELARADREARTASEATGFLVELFGDTDPFRGGDREVTVREVLPVGARRVETELADEPEVQGTLLQSIGDVYLNLGMAAEARALFERALAVRHGVFGERHPDVAESLDGLAKALRSQGEFSAAMPFAERALAMRRELLGDAHPMVAESLTSLGLLHVKEGRYEAAEALLAEALVIRRRSPDDRRIAVAESASNLAALYQLQGAYDRAEPLFREAAVIYRERLDLDHPLLATGLNNLATVLWRKGDLASAEPLLREALDLNRRRLGDGHPHVATILANLAAMLTERGDFTAAEPLARESLALRRRLLGGRHPDVGQSLNNLAALLQAKGESVAAESLYRDAVRLRRELLDASHPDLATSLVGLGGVLVDLGRAREAEPLLVEALAIRQRALPAGHWRIAAAQSELGGCLAALGPRRAAEAAALLNSSYPALAAVLGPNHRQTRRARLHLDALAHTP